MAEPTITFGAAQSFGTVTGWAEQSSDSAVNKDRAVALSRIGNEVASTLYNQRTEVSTPYVCTSNTNTVPAIIGSLVNSLTLTEIQINTTNTGYATMTLTGHNHATNAHADTLQQAAHSIAVAAAFGATDFLGGTAGSDAAVKSGNITISCDHTDVEDADGDHLIGNNHNGKIVAETVWTGVPSDTAASGWDKVTVSTATNNQGFLETTVRGEKALALATPS